MAIFNQHKTRQDSTEILNVERAPVPDSTALQQQILQVTEQLPQYVGESELADVYHGEKRFAQARQSFASRFTLLPSAGALVAGAAVIILSLTLWTPKAPFGVDETAELSTTLIMDELVLQDVILMSDEMAFATL